MKHQIATTPEQSRRVIACGVDPKSADMVWTDARAGRRLMICQWDPELANVDYLPAWSLGALLESMPDGEGQEMRYGYDPFSDDRERLEMLHPWHLNGDLQLYRNDSGYWIVDYDWDGFQGTLPQDKNPIEAVVQAVELLHANHVSLNAPKQ